jgi:hypothetical protein
MFLGMQLRETTCRLDFIADGKGIAALRSLPSIIGDCDGSFFDCWQQSVARHYFCHTRTLDSVDVSINAPLLAAII